MVEAVAAARVADFPAVADTVVVQFMVVAELIGVVEDITAAELIAVAMGTAATDIAATDTDTAAMDTDTTATAGIPIGESAGDMPGITQAITTAPITTRIIPTRHIPRPTSSSTRPSAAGPLTAVTRSPRLRMSASNGL